LYTESFWRVVEGSSKGKKVKEGEEKPSGLGIRTGCQRVSSLRSICLSISERSNVELYEANAMNVLSFYQVNSIILLSNCGDWIPKLHLTYDRSAAV
jgi:hypothetical protein